MASTSVAAPKRDIPHILIDDFQQAKHHLVRVFPCRLSHTR